MAKSVFIAGVDPSELPWLRMLLHLLRHPDRGTPELTRQALLSLATAADQHAQPDSKPLDHVG
jgi:hypothetical protein